MAGYTIVQNESFVQTSATRYCTMAEKRSKIFTYPDRLSVELTKAKDSIKSARNHRKDFDWPRTWRREPRIQSMQEEHLIVNRNLWF